MDYSTRFLKRHGEDCTIITRDPVVTSKCIVSPSSKSGFRITDRHHYLDGLMLPDANLVPGEVVSVSGKEILVFSADNDPVSGQTKFMGAKTNIRVEWQRQEEVIDDDYNVTKQWVTVSADIPAFGQVVTAYLRQEDPGLLENTKWLFHVPDIYDIKQMERVVFDTGHGAVSCQVDHIDGLILDGVIRLQCSDDTRA